MAASSPHVKITAFTLNHNTKPPVFIDWDVETTTKTDENLYRTVCCGVALEGAYCSLDEIKSLIKSGYVVAKASVYSVGAEASDTVEVHKLTFYGDEIAAGLTISPKEVKTSFI